MHVLGIAELKTRLGLNWNILSTFWTFSYLPVKTPSFAATCSHQTCQDSYPLLFSSWYKCPRYVYIHLLWIRHIHVISCYLMLSLMSH